MDVYDNSFNKDVIFEKITKINNDLENELKKDISEQDIEKENKLLYAQFIEGLKLSTLRTNNNGYYI